MKLSMTYRVRTKGFNHIFNETVRLYRRAVSFLNGCMPEKNGTVFLSFRDRKIRSGFMESLTVKTKQIPLFSMTSRRNFTSSPVTYDVLPLRKLWARHPLTAATWQTGEKRTRKTRKTVTAAGGIRVIRPCTVPVCSSRTGIPETALKVFYPQYLGLGSGRSQKSDADYIEHHCKNYKNASRPYRNAERSGFLDFVFQTAVKLPDTKIPAHRILAVDLGAQQCVYVQHHDSGEARSSENFFPFRENTTPWNMR